MHAERHTDAARACRGIDDDTTRADCVVTAMARFGEYEGCHDVADEAWRQECLFFEAEALARTGDHEGAMRACRAVRWASSCDEHVLDTMVMDTLFLEVPEAAARLAGVRGEAVARNPDLKFWRSWFRNRISRNMAIDPDACPTEACTEAARQEIFVAATDTMLRIGCDVPFEPAWGTATSTRRWTGEVRAKVCP